MTIESIKDSATMYSADTFITDLNGYFETSLDLGNAYKIGFMKESKNEDLKAISVYDAYLTTAAAVGMIKQSETIKMTADANNDGKITIYDALLIGNTAVGLDAGGIGGGMAFFSITRINE